MSAMVETLSAPAGDADRAERFHAFVATYQDRAVRIAYRLVGGDHAAAEDVAQEAFIRAHRGLAGFRQEASLSTWFYRILVREAHRHRHWRTARRWLRTTSLGELDLADTAPPPADPDLRQRIVTALEGLTTRQRDAVVLVHLEQFTVVETAAMLGTAPGTVKTHLHRGLRALREALADLAPAKAQPEDAR